MKLILNSQIPLCESLPAEKINSQVPSALSNI